MATTAVQISSGVVLDPAGPGEVLRELPVAGRDGQAVLADSHRPHSGRTGVDGDDHGHERQTLAVARSSGCIPGAAPCRRGGDKGAGARVLTAEGAASAALIDSTPEAPDIHAQNRNFLNG